MNNGLLDVAFRDTRSAIYTEDTKVAGNENGGNFTIEKMYLTSDADNLYVALDFGSIAPRGYGRSRFIVLVDNPNVAGSPVTIPAIQRPAYNTTIRTTTGTGNINQYVFKQVTATSGPGGTSVGPLLAVNGLTTPAALAGVDSNTNWNWTRCFDDWQYYPYNAPDGVPRAALLQNSYRVIKFKIARANIGVTANGQKVRVFAALSEGFESDNTSIFVRGFIPKAAAPAAVDNGETMEIDMANALEYTF
jgi:hypothetical protein